MQPGGKFAENIMHFARVLRAAGLPAGPGKTIDAIRAVEACGITRREDFYWALHAVFVNRQDQRELFDQAFHIFWRNPKILERMMSLLLPTVRPEDMPGDQQEMLRRLAEALMPGKGDNAGAEAEEEVRIDAVLTFSDKELLQGMDFEAMSADELARAKAAIARLRLPIEEVPTRRFRPSPNALRIDMRGTLRAGLRSGGAIIPLKRRAPKRRHPPLVVLCDISGSMARYSRMFLHFMHAITNDRDRVHSFLFGTRLTNVTRHLRHRDVDLALAKVTEQVEDWSGGTRIGQCLHQFNVKWGRRVLGQGAVVLFVSDGLDRDAAEGLQVEIQRLHKSCRRLVWLNPLLRWEGFEPKSKGIQAILPHVDEFRPVHNLDSLEQLTQVLSRPAQRREDGLGPWLAKRGAA
jgi:uncharacterized protein